MARDAKSALFKVKMGKEYYGFRAPKDAYKGIGTQLGVEPMKDTDNVQQSSKNKPPKVRINLVGAGSIIRFCDPGKMEALIAQGSLNGKKYDGKNINSVRPIHG